MKLFTDNIMKKKLLIVMCIITTTAILGTSIKKPHDYRKEQTGYIPKNGFVPDKITAIRIAIAVWLPVYGEIIYKEKPYSAYLKDGVWIVKGSIPKGNVGGVAMIAIQKKDGKIITMIHSK
jgi:hypothetical protein